MYNENLENIASTNFVQNVRMTDSTYQNLLSYRRRIRDAQEEFKQEIDNLMILDYYTVSCKQFVLKCVCVYRLKVDQLMCNLAFVLVWAF